MERQRIDKWLWHARVVRTRTAAADLAGKGLVRVNGMRIDAASRPVKAGDVLTIAFDRVRVLRVAGFSERRGSAADAAALFEDMTPPSPVSAAQSASELAPGPAARPDKQDRRALLRLKRPGNE